MMTIPRINWKKFISTGVLENTISTPSKQQSTLLTRNSHNDTSLQTMITELDRLLIQNDIVLEAINDAKHPFHLVAYEFVDTQLYDSRHLSAEFTCQLKTVKQTVLSADKKNQKNTQADYKRQLMLAKKKLKKLAEQVKYLAKFRTTASVSRK